MARVPGRGARRCRAGAGDRVPDARAARALFLDRDDRGGGAGRDLRAHDAMARQGERFRAADRVGLGRAAVPAEGAVRGAGARAVRGGAARDDRARTLAARLLPAGAARQPRCRGLGRDRRTALQADRVRVVGGDGVGRRRALRAVHALRRSALDARARDLDRHRADRRRRRHRHAVGTGNRRAGVRRARKGGRAALRRRGEGLRPRDLRRDHLPDRRAAAARDRRHDRRCDPPPPRRCAAAA